MKLLVDNIQSSGCELFERCDLWMIGLELDQLLVQRLRCLQIVHFSVQAGCFEQMFWKPVVLREFFNHFHP